MLVVTQTESVWPAVVAVARAAHRQGQFRHYTALERRREPDRTDRYLKGRNEEPHNKKPSERNF